MDASDPVMDDWTRWAPVLGRAARRSPDGYSLEEIRAKIEAGGAAMVTEGRSAAAVEFAKDCHVWLAAGDLAELLTGLPALERAARDSGCQRVTLSGRPGWERVLAPYGYRPIVRLGKELAL